MNDKRKHKWQGTPISQFFTSFKKKQFPELINDEEHKVLVQTPVIIGEVPECFPSLAERIDYWDEDHVKLPCSEKNVTNNGVKQWELIKQSLSSSILSCQDLEAAILSYARTSNKKADFITLRKFFDEICDERERSEFFQSLLPKIIDLALRLPEFITDGIPLLKHGRKNSISFSQVQIASLLANAFLCTFPSRSTITKGCEYANYPSINFLRLFQTVFKDRQEAVYEKLRFIIHYFRRITTTTPTGVVTFSRNHLSKSHIPDWSASIKELPRLYISPDGTIEDEGYGLFQLDFADRFIGGLILANGCVQEEIRFVICPELIISRLFTECISDNEAMLITGCERFSTYEGYNRSLKWTGDYVDTTPLDEYGRRYCTVVAVDALNYFKNPNDQYTPPKLNRELTKAYAGFSWGSHQANEPCGIATGNWGCGVFRGDVELKFLLQMMAAAESNRDVAYFTFGDYKLSDTLHSLHQVLVSNNVNVGMLYNILCDFNTKRMHYSTTSVYEYVRSEACRKAFALQKNEHFHLSAIETTEALYETEYERSSATVKKYVEKIPSSSSGKSYSSALKKK